MSGLSISDPVTLAEALTSRYVIPGDTLYLRAGTYSGDYVTAMAGVEGKPITVRPYANEQVIIDGALTINGAYTTWQDLIFTYSGWESRTTEISGSEPADMPVAKCVSLNARYTRVINCVMHNTAGFYTMSQSAGSEIYGNLMCRFGWSGPDRGHVHGIYAQNQAAYPQSIVEDNISFENFATGLKFYGEAGYCDNFLIQGNTCFNNGILYDRGIGSNGAHHHWDYLIGGLNIGQLDYLIDNMSYNVTDQALRGNNGIAWGDGLDSPVITGNYWAGREVAFNTGAYVGPMLTPTITGNTFVGPATRFADYAAGNTFVDWPGTGTTVFVRPNKYKPTRANVTIYNWDGADNVTVDLSSVTGLAAGNVVQVRNVQDYFTDIVSATLDANKKITIDMRAVSHTVAAPLLWPAAAKTYPTFGCFVIG